MTANLSMNVFTAWAGSPASHSGFLRRLRIEFAEYCRNSIVVHLPEGGCSSAGSSIRSSAIRCAKTTFFGEDSMKMMMTVGLALSATVMATA